MPHRFHQQLEKVLGMTPSSNMHASDQACARHGCPGEEIYSAPVRPLFTFSTTGRRALTMNKPTSDNPEAEHCVMCARRKPVLH